MKPLKTFNSGHLSYQPSPMNTMNNNMPLNTSTTVSPTGFHVRPSNDSMGLPKADSRDPKKSGKNTINDAEADEIMKHY